MKNLLLSAFVVFLFSCDNQNKKELKIDGLWLVKKVKVGQEEMTPIAKWMKFNADSTQTSGNGWLQHSFGSWSLYKNKLSMKNTNGLDDESEPFKISLEKSKMTWSRVEEGENIQVFLERINKIPASDGNNLMGLWKLDTVFLGHHTENLKSSSITLFLRWDNTYVIQQSKEEKYYGIYKIHGHKPELQMVNYGETPEFKFYKFSISDDKLTLTNTDTNTKLIYSRIHQFPK